MRKHVRNQLVWLEQAGIIGPQCKQESEIFKYQLSYKNENIYDDQI